MAKLDFSKVAEASNRVKKQLASKSDQMLSEMYLQAKLNSADNGGTDNILAELSIGAEMKRRGLRT